MTTSPYIEAITAIADLPMQFPISQIPPGISMWISRTEPTLTIRETATRQHGPVKSYEVSVEFSIHCRAGGEVLRLNPHPYILPDGNINTDLFGDEYPFFFRMRKNVVMKRWVSRQNPLRVFCQIHTSLLLVKKLCCESSNLSNLEQRTYHAS
jgi:hypothetical protein